MPNATETEIKLINVETKKETESVMLGEIAVHWENISARKYYNTDIKKKGRDAKIIYYANKSRWKNKTHENMKA